MAVPLRVTPRTAMDPAHQRQIEALYRAASAQSPGDRAVLLSGMSPELRREVETLLAIDEDASPVTMTMAQTVRPGTVLGPYEIEAPLGHGGMGQVFSAIDRRLGRKVAIKLSSEHFIDRFAREAKAISSLNHPHICTLHDVGPNYLVMELVEGETLAARLKRGKLSIAQSLEYAGQIAAALAAAHAKGIIHRDLKPGNIMISPSGVKVLDFGLAKTAGDETITASQAVMGTPGYMAPEQREGKPADARTDIYAFGCVLHEMLTGARPNSGPRIPSRHLEKIVSGCLETDPDRRPQSIAALGGELTAFGSAFPHWKTVAITALALVALAVGGYFYLHRAPKLTDKDTIVLADFENKTGDPVFDDTLRQGLTVQLQQSPYLTLVPDQKIHAMLTLMGTPVGTPLTGETAHVVCERVGARATLAGAIAKIGASYVLSLRAEGCAHGEALDNQQEQVSGKEQVLNTLSEMAGKFRSHAGESMAAIREHNVPLQEATTSSLEALKAYSAAVNQAGDSATSPLQRATELDPDFAVAWSHLAIQYSNRGDTALSRQAATRAWQARDRASGPEKFSIDYSYYRNVTGDLEKAWQSISLWRQTYPHDAQAFSLSAGYAANGTGRFQDALDAAVRSVALDPGHPYGYSNQTVALFHLGRFEDAEKSLAVDAAQDGIGGQEWRIGYRLAVLKQDKAGMAARPRGNQRKSRGRTHTDASAGSGRGARGPPERRGTVLQTCD